MTDEQKLSDLFVQFNIVNEKARESLLRRIHSSHVPKGKLLHLQGEVCERVWYIHTGLAHSFYTEDDGSAQITEWFAKERDVFTAISSFLTQTPSTESIEVLEPSNFLWITRTDLYELYMLHPEINTAGRITAEKYLDEAKRKLRMMRRQSAQERLAHFQSEAKDLFLRVPQKYIASYLGISQNYVSKLKGHP